MKLTLKKIITIENDIERNIMTNDLAYYIIEFENSLIYLNVLTNSLIIMRAKLIGRQSIFKINDITFIQLLLIIINLQQDSLLDYQIWGFEEKHKQQLWSSIKEIRANLLPF